jgi:hypothetical protein
VVFFCVGVSGFCSATLEASGVLLKVAVLSGLSATGTSLTHSTSRWRWRWRWRWRTGTCWDCRCLCVVGDTAGSASTSTGSAHEPLPAWGCGVSAWRCDDERFAVDDLLTEEEVGVGALDVLADEEEEEQGLGAVGVRELREEEEDILAEDRGEPVVVFFGCR